MLHKIVKNVVIIKNIRTYLTIYVSEKKLHTKVECKYNPALNPFISLLYQFQHKQDKSPVSKMLITH